MNAIDLNYKVDLAAYTNEIKTLDRPLFYGDSNAHRINVTITRNGLPEDLTGMTCGGYIVFEDTQQTLILSDTASISGNVASVILPEDAYLTTGRVYIVVRLSGNDNAITVLAIYAWVSLGETSEEIIPSTSRLNYDQILAIIDDMQDLIDAAGDLTDVVKYGSAQSLTDVQKTQARDNIGAISGNDVGFPVESWWPLFDKYFVTDYNGQFGTIRGNHYIYTPTSSNAIGGVRCIVNTFSHTQSSLGDFVPTEAQTIPVSLFGGTIRISYRVDISAETTRIPRFGYKFVTIDDGTLTAGPYGSVPYTAKVGELFVQDISIPSGVTHVFFCILFSGITANVTYDMTYSVAANNITVDEFEAFSGRVDALHGLIDYKPLAYFGADFVRIGTRFWANHTYSSASSMIVFRLNGAMEILNSNSGVDDLTNPIRLTVGNRYRLSVKQMSGTITKSNGESGDYLAYPIIYTAGTHTATGTSSNLIPIGTNSYAAEFEYTQDMDTAGGVQLCLRFTRTSGNITTNWVAQIILTDVTNDSSLTISGTTPTIVALENSQYICGTLSTLNFTPSSTGISDVIFTSGTTATVLTVPSGISWPDWFDPTNLDASTTYELNVLNGVYGAVMKWT